MKKKPRPKSGENRQPKPTTLADAAPHRETPRSSKRLAAHVCGGLLLTGVLLAAKFGAEHTQTGEFIEQSFYELLQLRLSLEVDPEALRVVVVDIDGMRMDRHPRDRSRDFTNRDELITLLRTISDQQPRAIGVDLDFTPYADQTDQDRRFLDFARALRTPSAASHTPAVPVYVGIRESVALGPELALNQARFAELAAFIGFPRPGKADIGKRIPGSIDIQYRDAMDQQRVWSCPSLASAVTQVHPTPPPKWISWALDGSTFMEGVGYRTKEFLIDYGALEALEQKTVRFKNLEGSLRQNFFYDKYIFVGRGIVADGSGDQYIIPGRRSHPYSGVYVHASAAQTLLRGALFEPSAKGRLVLDVILSMFVVIGVAVVHYRYQRRSMRLSHRHLLALFTFAAITVTVFVGFYAIHITRMLWSDFVVVAVGLMVHRSVDEKLDEKMERIIVWPIRCVPRVWYSLIGRDGKASDREEKLHDVR